MKITKKFFIIFFIFIISINNAILADNETEFKKIFSSSAEMIKAGDLNQAEQILNKLLDEGHRSAMIYNNLAVVNFKKGNIKKAKFFLESAFKENKNFSNIYNNLQKISDYETAVTYNEIISSSNKPIKPKLNVFNKIKQKSDLTDKQLVNSTESNQNLNSKNILKSKTISHKKYNNKTQENKVIDYNKIELSNNKNSLNTNTKTDVKNINNNKIEISNLLNKWAASWSAGDSKKYLSFYSVNFKPNNLSLIKWRQQRKQRIYPGRNIKVSINNLTILINENKAEARFSQNYASVNFKSHSRKTIYLNFENGKWLITKELVN